MTHALPNVGYAGLFTHWTVQPLAVAAAVALVVAYAAGVRVVRRRTVWPLWRTIVFAVGLALLLGTSCGWLEVYAPSLYWAWTLQTLILMLVVPIVVLAGGPLQLARLAGTATALDKFLHSRTGRAMANPLLGPAVIPVLSAVLFFGPVPAWAVHWRLVGGLIQLAVLVIGGFVVLPLVGPEEHPSSLAVGLSLAIGSFELVLDAVPGIALRLHASLVTSFFDHRVVQSWSPTPVHDQQVAGSILWCVAEVIDLPFLLLVFRRWLRADARDAAEIDAVLDAERLARAGLSDEGAAEPLADAPWWLTDPAMQRRFRGEDR